MKISRIRTTQEISDPSITPTSVLLSNLRAKYSIAFESDGKRGRSGNTISSIIGIYPDYGAPSLIETPVQTDMAPSSWFCDHKWRLGRVEVAFARLGDGGGTRYRGAASTCCINARERRVQRVVQEALWSTRSTSCLPLPAGATLNETSVNLIGFIWRATSSWLSVPPTAADSAWPATMQMTREAELINFILVLFQTVESGGSWLIKRISQAVNRLRN